jgi:chromosome segregation ATPase
MAAARSAQQAAEQQIAAGTEATRQLDARRQALESELAETRTARLRLEKQYTGDLAAARSAQEAAEQQIAAGREAARELDDRRQALESELAETKAARQRLEERYTLDMAAARSAQEAAEQQIADGRDAASKLDARRQALESELAETSKVYAVRLAFVS